MKVEIDDKYIPLLRTITRSDATLCESPSEALHTVLCSVIRQRIYQEYVKKYGNSGLVGTWI